MTLKIQNAGMWRVSVTVMVIKDVQDKYDQAEFQVKSHRDELKQKMHKAKHHLWIINMISRYQYCRSVTPRVISKLLFQIFCSAGS